MVYSYPNNYFSAPNHNYSPSAPPMDDDFAPSAPPADEEYYTSSLPPLYESYKTPQTTKKVERQLDLKESCPICLDNLGDHPEGDKHRYTVVAKTICSHFFHNFCLQQHLNNGMNSNCPICRHSLLESGNVTEINVNKPTPMAVGEKPKPQTPSKSVKQKNNVTDTGISVGKWMASLGYSSLKVIGSTALYGLEKGLSLFIESPTLAKVVENWNILSKNLKNKNEKQKEEVELLLSMIASLPDHPNSQKVLKTLDKSIKNYHLKMEYLQDEFIKSIADIDKERVLLLNSNRNRL